MRELQFGGRAIVGERSFGGAGGQISDSSSAVGGGKRGLDRHHANGRHERFVSFFMAASVSALNPTCKSQNYVVLFSPNESSTIRALQPVTDLLLPMWCSRHSRRGPVRAAFGPIAQRLSTRRSRRVKGKLRALPISRPPKSTARRSQ